MPLIQIHIQAERLASTSLINHSYNLIQLYGFTSNPLQTISNNFNNALLSITNQNGNTSQHLKFHKKQPQNLTVHNLCQTNQPPPGTKLLLDLGLKFCIPPPKPSPNIKECLKKLAYSIRTKQYLLDNPHRPNQTYIPQIYIKLKDWHPPPASLNTENRITLFEKNVRQAVESNNHKQHPYTNLTSVQREVLKQLKQSKDLVILPTDKNLGPAILNRDQYITQVLSEHL
jgi:hypothetical protein